MNEDAYRLGFRLAASYLRDRIAAVDRAFAFRMLAPDGKAGWNDCMEQTLIRQVGGHERGCER